MIVEHCTSAFNRKRNCNVYFYNSSSTTADQSLKFPTQFCDRLACSETAYNSETWLAYLLIY